MDITMIGLQNAGKTSLLRVLAVSEFSFVDPACIRFDAPCDMHVDRNVKVNSRGIILLLTRVSRAGNSRSSKLVFRFENLPDGVGSGYCG
jgi:GTPase SAR1 family protein